MNETGSTDRYHSGDLVRLGDRVCLQSHDGSAFGRVVFVIGRREYSPDFPEQDWSYLEHGFMVRFDDGLLIHYRDPDPQLSLMERS